MTKPLLEMTLTELEQEQRKRAEEMYASGQALKTHGHQSITWQLLKYDGERKRECDTEIERRVRP